MKLFSLRKKKTERITTRKKKITPGKKGMSAGARLSILQLSLFWILLLSLFYGSGGGHPPITELAEGQRADKTIVAAVNFECENISQTELARSQAADKIVPVFRIDEDIAKSAGQQIRKLAARLELAGSLPEDKAESAAGLVNDLLDLYNLKLTFQDFSPMQQEKLSTRALQALEETVSATLTRGIITPLDKTGRFGNLASSGRITLQRDNSPEQLDLQNIADEKEAAEAALAHLAETLKPDQTSEETLGALLSHWIRANLVYDAARTEALKKEAQSRVVPVTETILAGTPIVSVEKRLNAQDILRLRAHEEALAASESRYTAAMRTLGGAALLFAALLAVSGIYYVMRRTPQVRNKRLFLLLILILIPLAADKSLLLASMQTRLISPALVSYILPHAAAPMLATILLGNVAGITAGLMTSIAAAILFNQNFHIFLSGLVVSVVAIYMLRDAKRRSTIFRAGFCVSLAQVFYVCILAVINRPAGHVFGAQLGLAAAGGFICAAATVLLIPLFETLFKITTDITLLELSDMGHPLLQRMAIEAPGTYHHSLMVASLASAAAERVGANALLTRVCAYFHDIGKLVKPEFFTENTREQESPHDTLSPNMSTLIIMSHIKEGQELARKFRLPEQIIDAIAQHHGTGMIKYFYHRAKQQAEDSDTEVKDSDFRYPGPRPVTPEMAILSIADSVEAAARSLEKATPSRIEGLVDQIVRTKMEDRQLDLCELTFTQLSQIKESLVFNLTNMLHARVAYPDDDENNRTKQTEKTSGQPAGNPKTGETPEQPAGGNDT